MRLAVACIDARPEDTMTRNLGTVDRALRVALGFVLIALSAPGTIGPWGYVGIVPIGTALAGYCPIYRLLRISSVGARR
jgi:hypothetical protein